MKPRIRFLISLLLVATPLWAQSDFWTPTGGPAGTRVSGVAIAPDGNVFAGTLDDGVFRSTDHGTSWVAVNNGLTGSDIHALCYEDGRLYAGTMTGLVFYSDDQGDTWTSTGSTCVQNVYSVGPNSAGSLFASGTDGICRSTDDGSSWDMLDIGMPQLMIWSAVLVIDENIVISGSIGMGAIRSTNAGTSWQQVFPGPPDNIIYSFFRASNGEVFAATGMGIYKSNDDGIVWTEVPDPENSDITLVLVDHSGRYIAVTRGGVFQSIDGGNLWTPAQTGLGDQTILSLAMSADGTIYAGTDGGVYMTSSVTSVEDTPQLPEKYSLSQNYPNPFNPGTTINFSVMEEGMVTLRVFDLTGREVATLINDQLAPGTYARHSDASEMASGVYHYRMTAGGTSQTRTMVLVK